MADISLDTLTLFKAVTSDPDKMAVLSEIEGRMRAVEEAQTKLAAQRAEFAAEQKAARDDRATAEAARQEAQSKAAALTQETDGLRSAIETHTRDKQSFEEVRQRVDAEHEAREASLTQRESVADGREDQLRQREASIKAREAQVGVSEAMWSRRWAALNEAQKVA